MATEKFNIRDIVNLDECIQRMKDHFHVKDDKELRERLKYGQSAFSMAKNKGRGFPYEMIAKFCFQENKSFDWLLFGVGPTVDAPLSSQFEQEFTLIPLYGAVLSGGPGSLQTSDEIQANFAFRTEFVRRKGNGKHLCLFTVKGSSMAPRINDKDIVMVNLAENDPKLISDGKIYAFRDGDVVKVKRLSRQGETISVSSGPENSPKDEGPIKDFSSFELFGLVVWVGHELE
jgi:SOS-response transcriptional repressor LexA